MLYLLMVRARPFEGATDLETLLRVQKGDYPPPEAIAPDLEPEVAAIINRSMRLDPAERYQTADDMLTDLERVLRTVFQPVGQTELKRWLHDLSVLDGHPPIGKAPERLPSARQGTGELEGKDVVLSDSQDDDEEQAIDGEAVTSLAVVEGGGGAGRMRLSRHRGVAAPSLPVPRDAETDQQGRPSEELAALPISDTEERPGRRSGRGGGGLFKVLIFGLIVVGGAWYGGRYYRQWFGGGEPATETGAGTATSAGPTETATKPAGAAPRAVPAKTEPPAGKSHAAPAAAGRADVAPAAAPTSGAAEPADEPVKAQRTPPARESGNRRTRKEREKEKQAPRKAPGPDLKSMMAPDPSQLPEAPSRPAPSEPAPPPAPVEP